MAVFKDMATSGEKRYHVDGEWVEGHKRFLYVKAFSDTFSSKRSVYCQHTLIQLVSCYKTFWPSPGPTHFKAGVFSKDQLHADC